jgi:hypothetical protein
LRQILIKDDVRKLSRHPPTNDKVTGCGGKGRGCGRAGGVESHKYNTTT